MQGMVLCTTHHPQKDIQQVLLMATIYLQLASVCRGIESYHLTVIVEPKSSWMLLELLPNSLKLPVDLESHWGDTVATV